MAKADFYVLPTATERERCVFACQLVEKIYRQGLFCYILTDSESQNQTLDQLLWTFRPNSFIPHDIYTGNLPNTKNSVLIGSLPAPDQWQSVVLNLSSRPPEPLLHIKRLLEIIDNREPIKYSARQRYRYYQQQQIELVTHTL